MSAARYNILNKLKAANATVLREPEVAEYYAEMTQLGKAMSLA